jgi:hypothetical protein
MITDEQILQIASSYLRELYSGDVGDVVWQPLREDALLNFARAIYEIAYNEGHDEGWESREEAEYFNSSYPTGLVGDPQ